MDENNRSFGGGVPGAPRFTGLQKVPPRLLPKILIGFTATAIHMSFCSVWPIFFSTEVTLPLIAQVTPLRSSIRTVVTTRSH